MSSSAIISETHSYLIYYEKEQNLCQEVVDVEAVEPLEEVEFEG
jgi:hypothetical protein